MQNWIYRITHWLLYAIAALLVFSAIVFTVTRAMTPYLTLHHKAFEDWASHLLGTEVKVKRVAFGWRGVEPEMWLKDVSIYDPKTQKQISQIKNLYVAMDITQSFIHRQVIPSEITISGFKLAITQLPNHQYEINDVNVSVKNNQVASISGKALEQWLFSETHIYLKNFTIVYSGLNKKNIQLEVARLGFLSEGVYHQLTGNFTVNQPGYRPLSGNIVMHAQGDVLDYQNMRANLYLHLSNLAMSNWLSSASYGGYWLHQGIANGEFWLSWSHGSFNNISTRLRVYDLELHSAISGNWFKLSSLSGDIVWKRTDTGWRLSADNLSLINKNRIWPKTQLLLEKENNKESLWLNYMNLADINNFLSGCNQLSVTSRNLITELKPQGEVENLSASLTRIPNQPLKYSVSADLKNVSVQRYKKIPGFTNVSGALQGTDQGGKLLLDSNNVILDFGGVFRQPLRLSKLNGSLSWYPDQKGNVIVQTQSLALSNNDVAIDGKVGLIFPSNKKAPYISVLAGFKVSSPMVVSHYLPVNVISKKTTQWLDKAFISGDALNGKVMLRGDLKNFPFKRNKGVFIVDSSIRNLSLHYGNNWPDLKNINGDLLFDGNQMTIRADSASLFTAQLSHLTAIIPNLSAKAPLLKIKGQVDDDSGDLVRFIDSSPLHTSLGVDLKPLSFKGETKLNLQLNIPLLSPEETNVKGDVNFNNVTLSAPAWKLAVDKLNGNLGFTNTTLNSHNLKGYLFGSPTTFSFGTKQEKIPVIQMKASGMPPVNNIFNAFKLAKPKYLSGKVQYNATLTLHLNNSDPRQNTLSLNSDLLGLSVALPAPFGKTPEEVLSASIKLYYKKMQPYYLFADLSKSLSAAIILNHQNDELQFYNANIMLGGDPAKTQSAAGISITGKLDRFNWNDWGALLVSQKQSLNNELTSFLKKEAVDLTLQVGRLTYGNFTFSPAQIALKRLSGLWQFGLKTSDIDGYLNVPDDYPKAPLDGVFQTIGLPTFNNKTTDKFNPNKIPPLDLSVANFTYKQYHLQHVKLSLRPLPNGVEIKDLSVRSKKLNASLLGQWTQDKTGEHSALKGNLSSDDFASVAKEFYPSSSVIAKRASANIDLSWPGAVYDFDLKAWRGDMNLVVYNGWVLDLGAATTQKLNLGRLLTLLSVRHLLMFHLNDLSRNGYSFDKLSADLHFNSGIVTTENLQSEGAVADIKAKGMVDLKTKTLDLWMGVDTNLSASLPIIATIAGGPIFGPIAGAATWVVSKFVHNEMREHSGYGYHIYGAWAKPTIKQITTDKPS